MQSYQIVTGISDLKVLFRTRTKTTKSLQELELWCSFESDILWLHDYHQHKQAVIVAMYLKQNNVWIFYTVDGSFGDKLLRLVTATNSSDKIAEVMNEYLRSFGFRISSGE